MSSGNLRALALAAALAAWAMPCRADNDALAGAGAAAVSASGASGQLEPASEAALLQTQQLLRDPKARAEAISKDPKAGRADAAARKLAGSSKGVTESIYDLSADLMETITRQAGGDAEKMNRLLDEALQDPEAFAAKFTPEQKAKLRSIAGQLPDPAATRKSPP